MVGLGVWAALQALNGCATQGTFGPNDAGQEDSGTTPPNDVPEAGRSDAADAGSDAKPEPPPEPPVPFEPKEAASESVHTTFGLPEATTETPTRYYLKKKQYVVYFDAERKAPRWASWELSRDWLGTVSRSTSFKADVDLPASYAQAKNSDYATMGFDRGHLVPSGDRTENEADNLSTFVYSNAVPQHPSSNSGVWSAFETEVRRLVASGDRAFQITGPLYPKGTPQTIGEGVEVPEFNWKVVLIVGNDNPILLSKKSRTIAIVVPNSSAASGPWRNYRTTVRDIEERTGFDFFSDVPRKIQDAIETVQDEQ
jgi:endonuclease G, mitochondrial